MNNISGGNCSPILQISRRGATAVGLMATCLTLSLLMPNDAEAKRGYYGLVPPPPPTPVLSMPPPPVVLPYSYAMSNANAMPHTVQSQLTIVQPKPPAPPRPIGLSPVVAQARGFGTPRVPYTGNLAGAALAKVAKSATDMNTWFESSLCWYNGHLNAQDYYQTLSQRPETGIRSTPYAVESGMFADVPQYMPPTRPYEARGHSNSNSRRFGHPKRVLAYK